MTISFIMSVSSMTLILMMMIMIISSTLMNTIHPLALILTLVVFTISSLMVMYIKLSLSMYFYMIFISIIGGMMIMFLYFTSMINNYPSKIKMNELMMIMYMSIIMFIMVLLYSYLPVNKMEFNLNNNFNHYSILIHKIYLYPLNILTVITILNLLYCLILTIKMCSSKYSPLRKINYEKL